VGIRVAVIGLGKMALLHASILGSMDNAKVVAFCEISPLVRRFAREIFPSVRVVSSVPELAGMNLDAVYITTPAGSHFPIIKTVYDMAIAHHVFVEKPLATSFARAKEACELARRHGGVNMVGYNRRFSVTFTRARQILGEGLLGELTSFEAYAYSSDFYGAKANPKGSARGGVISDLGCHVADLALWLLGPMDVASAKVRSLLGGPSEDEADFSVLTANGLKGQIKTSWCRPEYRMPEIGLTIVGAKGTLKVDEDKVQLSLDSGQRKTWYKHDLSDEVPFFIGGTEYVREDHAFVRSIADGGSVEPSFETASEVERLIDEVKRTGSEAR
jgi:predicted dehydrogenase